MTIPANNGQATGTTRLTGKARGELERQILDNPAVKGIDRLVLIELFGWFRGKAVCWPGNVAIASAAGLCPRSVQNAVKRLEDAEVIKTVDDSSVRSRRQIVLLDHSGATAALAALNASPHVNPDRCRSNPAKIAAAKAAKTPSDNSNGRVNQIHPEGCTRFTPEGEPDSPKAHNCVSARPESPPTPTSESTPSSSSSSN
jgi:hypothetical protein